MELEPLAYYCGDFVAIHLMVVYLLTLPLFSNLVVSCSFNRFNKAASWNDYANESLVKGE